MLVIRGSLFLRCARLTFATRNGEPQYGQPPGAPPGGEANAHGVISPSGMAASMPGRVAKMRASGYSSPRASMMTPIQA
jgi:hypothetical protein